MLVFVAKMRFWEDKKGFRCKIEMKKQWAFKKTGYFGPGPFCPSIIRFQVGIRCIETKNPILFKHHGSSIKQPGQ